MQSITDLAFQLAGLPSNANLTEFLLKQLKEYTGASLIVYSDYNSDNKSLIINHIEANQTIIELTYNILGKRLLNTVIPISETIRLQMMDDIVGLRNSITDVTFGMFPYQTLDNAIKYLTGIDRYFGIAFVTSGELFGTAVIAMKANQPDPDRDFLISFSHLAAISLRRKKAEDKLYESEIKFEKVFRSSPDVIIISAVKNGKIIEVNDNFSIQTGYSREEYIGKSSLELNLWVNPIERNQYINLLKDQKKIENLEIDFCKKSGEIRHALLSGEIIELHNETHTISIIRDITEQKKALQELKIKDTLLELTNHMAKVGGWEFDPKTKQGTWTNEVALIHELESSLLTNVALGISFYHEKYRELIEKAIDEAITKQKPYDLELEMTTKNNTSKWVRTMGMPIIEDGKVVKIRGIFQDITFRKLSELKIENERARLRTLIETIPDLVWLKDTEGIYLTCNRKFERFFGAKEHEIIGKTDYDFVSKELADSFRMNDREAQKAGKPKINLEWVTFSDDGHQELLETIKTPMFDSENKLIGILGVARNITELHQSQEEIKQLHANLERRVEERTTELLVANKELEAFAYTVSHDLRAPLRAIAGFTQILTEDFAKDLPDEGKHICSVIIENTQRMGHLIDDLLAFSRVGRSDLNLSNIDSNRIINIVYQELTTPEQREKIIFIVDPLPTVLADNAMIKQVWFNLISNAIKFSSKCSNPEIKIWCYTKDTRTIFTIKDNGSGFGMKYANKLFGVFQRFHSNKEYEGTGVGLAIVQRIIQRHGGTIWAEAEINNGAQFYFTLSNEVKNEINS
ncbi:MAG: PAS domain S-box protein [Bacteroidetes bacterium]|nr:PAS domain S-box protein [Bacteroidota bacterium]